MTIQSMRQTNFQVATKENWEEVALKSLKGKSLDTLTTKTIEEIILKPLYQLTDLESVSENQVNIIRESKASGNWAIAQEASGNSVEQVLEDIKNSLDKGNEVIRYKVKKDHLWSEEQLTELHKYTEHTKIIVDVKENPSFVSKLNELPCFVIGGSEKQHSYLDGLKVHKDGGDAVSELVSVLLQADELLNESDIASLTNNSLAHFAMDTNFFMEIAKLRAFRILWKAFGEANGEDNIQTIPVLAETSLRSFSVLDPYVNLLRAGNSTLSAVLGGADYITVLPYDYLIGETAASKRFARNIQLMIKEESHIGRVIDAVGGSYYLETITNELVRKSWNLFIELVKDEPSIREEKLKQRTQQKWEEQLSAVGTRKKSLIGTNIYANPSDSFTKVQKGEEYKRLAEPFENLKEGLQNSPLKAAILPYGTLKEYKARLDFVSGFLTAIGVVPIVSPSNMKPFDLQAWINENDIQYAVFVGNDEQTAGLVPALLNEKITIPLDVAGKFEEYEDWLEAGLSGRIFAGQSLLEKGKELLDLAQGGLQK